MPQSIVNLACSDGGLPRGNTDLIESANHVACRLQSRNRRVLKGIEQQIAVAITLYNEFVRQIRARVAAKHRIGDVEMVHHAIVGAQRSQAFGRHADQRCGLLEQVDAGGDQRRALASTNGGVRVRAHQIDVVRLRAQK